MHKAIMYFWQWLWCVVGGRDLVCMVIVTWLSFMKAAMPVTYVDCLEIVLSCLETLSCLEIVLFGCAVIAMSGFVEAVVLCPNAGGLS